MCHSVFHTSFKSNDGESFFNKSFACLTIPLKLIGVDVVQAIDLARGENSETVLFCLFTKEKNWENVTVLWSDLEVYFCL